MGCKSCKDKKGGSKVLDSLKNTNTNEKEPKDFGFKLFNIVVRTILFAISLALVPVILLLVIYLLFKIIMLNRGDVNLMPSLVTLARSMGIGKKKVEEKHPEDYEDLDSSNPSDYEIDEKVDKIVL